jgi:hypothetical protein
MAVEYKDSSPWGRTPFNTDGHLGIFQIRPVPAEDDDPLYELEPQYIYRPDLLFFDFVPGVKIYLPKKDNLLQVLGV